MRIATALAIVAFAALPASAFAQTVTMTAGQMSMQGHGEVYAAPDTAFVSSGVTSQAATARGALDANTKAMTDLIATLKAAGIESRDIQTSGFSVSPNYVYTDERDANGYALPPKINGYVVGNMVTVRVRALASLGIVLDQMVTVGANTINSVSFSVDDPRELYEEARLAAFKDAKAKADLYAGAAGIGLGNIVSISESTGYSPQPYLMREMASDVAASAPVPVETGEMAFSIDVSVTWTLSQ